MKLGAVAEFDKRNTATSKTIGDDLLLVNCDVIAIFLICCQFGVSRSWILVEWYIKLISALTVTFYFTKTEIGIRI